jgi:hypothetical protein
LTQRAKAWLTRRVGADADTVAALVRELGLGWATVPSTGYTMQINEKPMFRKAFASRRLLVPVDGFYEWFTEDAPDGARPVKQPFYLRVDCTIVT